MSVLLDNEGAKEMVGVILADQDAATNARLDYIVKVLGKCRYCGAKLSDNILARTPGVCSQRKCKSAAKREVQSMGVQGEHNPHALNYLYVVGGEDYEFREIKRIMAKMNVNCSGHASVHWKSAFHIPPVTTHILHITDVTKRLLQDCAESQSRMLNIPVIEAPIRNKKWGDTLVLLKKYGLFEENTAVDPNSTISGAPTSPPVALDASKPPDHKPTIVPRGTWTCPWCKTTSQNVDRCPSCHASRNAPSPRPTIATVAESLQAKGREPPAISIAPPSPPPAPKAPAPVAAPSPFVAAVTAPFVAPQPPKEEKVYTHVERARLILTESKGALSNKDISSIISDESKLDCPPSLVAEQRKKLKLPQAKIGKKSKELKALIAHYRSKKVRTKPAEEIVQAVAPEPVADMDADDEPRQEAPVAQTSSRPIVASVSTDDEALASAIQTHLDMLKQDIINKYGLGRLQLTFTGGNWQDPEVERVVVHRGTIKLKR